MEILSGCFSHDYDKTSFRCGPLFSVQPGSEEMPILLQLGLFIYFFTSDWMSIPSLIRGFGPYITFNAILDYPDKNFVFSQLVLSKRVRYRRGILSATW